MSILSWRGIKRAKYHAPSAGEGLVKQCQVYAACPAVLCAIVELRNMKRTPRTSRMKQHEELKGWSGSLEAAVLPLLCLRAILDWGSIKDMPSLTHQSRKTLRGLIREFGGYADHTVAYVPSSHWETWGRKKFHASMSKIRSGFHQAVWTLRCSSSCFYSPSSSGIQ